MSKIIAAITTTSLVVLVSGALVSAAPNPPTAPVKPKTPPPPPPISEAPGRPLPNDAYVYDQKPLPGQPVLIAPQQAQAVIERFRSANEKLGNPRILIYVNRDLVDENSGLNLSEQTEKSESSRNRINSDFKTDPNAGTAGPNSVTVNAGGNVTVNAGAANNGSQGTLNTRSDRVTKESRYKYRERTQSLADRQTVRDIERLFGRPLRAARASLVDQRLATQLMAGKSRDVFSTQAESETTRKDREAVAKVADVVLEVLVSSRNLVVQEVSGDKVYSVPDIQATAIRVSDSKVIGQASATDVLGKDRYAGRIVKNFDVREIAEATALALMEDIASAAE